MLRYAVGLLRSYLNWEPLQGGDLNNPGAQSQSERPYALITGATDGIGLELAKLLASRYRFNLVLHGRSPSKLEKSKQAVLQAYRDEHGVAQQKKTDDEVKVLTLLADASKAREIDYEADFVDPLRRANGGKGVDLTLVVHNVGGASIAALNQDGANQPGRLFQLFGDRADAELFGLIDMNLLFPMALTRHLLPLLQAPSSASAGAKKALVVTISSAVSEMPMPGIATYSAAKAGLNGFISALGIEQQIEPQVQQASTPKRKVETQNFVVGAVRTRRLRNTPHDFFTPNAEDFVVSMSRVLGDGHSVGSAYFGHALQRAAGAFTPQFVQDSVRRSIGMQGISGHFDQAD